MASFLNIHTLTKKTRRNFQCYHDGLVSNQRRVFQTLSILMECKLDAGNSNGSFSTLNNRVELSFADELDCETKRALLLLGLFLPLSQAQLNHIPCTTEHISPLKIESKALFLVSVLYIFFFFLPSEYTGKMYRHSVYCQCCLYSMNPTHLNDSVLAFCICVRFSTSIPVRVLSVLFS